MPRFVHSYLASTLCLYIQNDCCFLTITCPPHPPSKPTNLYLSSSECNLEFGTPGVCHKSHTSFLSSCRGGCNGLESISGRTPDRGWWPLPLAKPGLSPAPRSSFLSPLAAGCLGYGLSWWWLGVQTQLLSGPWPLKRWK